MNNVGINTMLEKQCWKVPFITIYVRTSRYEQCWYKHNVGKTMLEKQCWKVPFITIYVRTSRYGQCWYKERRQY
jgi:hypothetical protein